MLECVRKHEACQWVPTLSWEEGDGEEPEAHDELKSEVTSNFLFIMCS